MDVNRFVEITAEIDSLLAQPMPPPAEKHLLREKIFALKYEQLGLSGDLPETERDQEARDFTLEKVPQRVHSYPMHLRETPMPATVYLSSEEWMARQEAKRSGNAKK